MRLELVEYRYPLMGFPEFHDPDLGVREDLKSTYVTKPTVKREKR